MRGMRILLLITLNRRQRRKQRMTGASASRRLEELPLGNAWHENPSNSEQEATEKTEDDRGASASLLALFSPVQDSAKRRGARSTAGFLAQLMLDFTPRAVW